MKLVKSFGRLRPSSRMNFSKLKTSLKWFRESKLSRNDINLVTFQVIRTTHRTYTETCIVSKNSYSTRRLIWSWATISGRDSVLINIEMDYQEFHPVRKLLQTFRNGNPEWNGSVAFLYHHVHCLSRRQRKYHVIKTIYHTEAHNVCSRCRWMFLATN